MRAPILSLLFFCTFCPLALGLTLEEPLEKRILTPINPGKYGAGVCPGNPARTINPPPARKQTFEANAVRDAHEVAAMYAAAAIYKLGDLESFTGGDQFVQDTYGFLSAIPEGYKFYFYAAEPVSGLKYIVLQPTQGGPWILSIAGTQSALDWIVDLDLGRTQFAALSKLLGMLTTCQYMDESNQPLASRDWIVTGHSLGGGMAQGVAYEIQRRRLEAGLQPVRMELITFNGFGSQELIAKTQTYEPAIVPYLSATNFFVRGDEVSRIGTHIGETRELVAPEGVSVIGKHAMETIIGIAENNRTLLSGLADAADVEPPARQTFRRLLPVASVISKLAFAGYDEGREDQVVARLSEATDAVEGLDFSDGTNVAVLMFTRRLLLSRIAAWDQSDNGIMRDTSVRKLKSLYKRLSRIGG